MMRLSVKTKKTMSAVTEDDAEREPWLHAAAVDTETNAMAVASTRTKTKCSRMQIHDAIPTETKQKQKGEKERKKKREEAEEQQLQEKGEGRRTPIRRQTPPTTTGVNISPYKDRCSIALLLLLYTLQGVPMGLSGSLPLLFSGRISYKQQSLLSLVSLPFSLKLLWAPIVDAMYIRGIGRRRSWLLPAQFLAGFLMVWASYPSRIDTWIANDGGGAGGGGEETLKPRVEVVAFFFTVLYFLMATQDIAVDGWALTILSPAKRGVASTCNTVGQTIGYFVAYGGFLAFSDAATCVKVLPAALVPRHPLTGAPLPLVSLAGFLRFWGWVIVLTSAVILFLFPEDSGHSSSSSVVVPSSSSSVADRNGRRRRRSSSSSTTPNSSSSSSNSSNNGNSSISRSSTEKMSLCCQSLPHARAALEPASSVGGMLLPLADIPVFADEVLSPDSLLPPFSAKEEEEKQKPKPKQKQKEEEQEAGQELAYMTTTTTTSTTTSTTSTTTTLCPLTNTNKKNFHTHHQQQQRQGAEHGGGHAPQQYQEQQEQQERQLSYCCSNSSNSSHTSSSTSSSSSSSSINNATDYISNSCTSSIRSHSTSTSSGMSSCSSSGSGSSRLRRRTRTRQTTLDNLGGEIVAENRGGRRGGGEEEDEEEEKESMEKMPLIYEQRGQQQENQRQKEKYHKEQRQQQEKDEKEKEGTQRQQQQKHQQQQKQEEEEQEKLHHHTIELTSLVDLMQHAHKHSFGFFMKTLRGGIYKALYGEHVEEEEEAEEEELQQYENEESMHKTKKKEGGGDAYQDQDDEEEEEEEEEEVDREEEEEKKNKKKKKEKRKEKRREKQYYLIEKEKDEKREEKEEKQMEHKEEEEEERSEEPEGVLACYKLLLQMLFLKPVRELLLLLLTCRVAFACVDSATQLKLLDAGIKKEDLAFFAPFVLPFGILCPIMVGKFLHGRFPMKVFSYGYVLRMLMTLVWAGVVWKVGVLLENGSTEASQTRTQQAMLYAVLLCVTSVYNICSDLMFVSQMAFFAKVSDPRIGGTYMTFLNTVTNLGSKWPHTLSLLLMDYTSIRDCSSSSSRWGDSLSSPPASSEPSETLLTEAADNTPGAAAAAATTTTECPVWIDAYYVQTAACFLIGLVWLRVAWGHIDRLQRVPLSDWRVCVEDVKERGGGAKIDNSLLSHSPPPLHTQQQQEQEQQQHYHARQQQQQHDVEQHQQQQQEEEEKKKEEGYGEFELSERQYIKNTSFTQRNGRNSNKTRVSVC